MRIGELAERTGVSRRSLRYYEDQGLIRPARTARGQRAYAVADVERVIRIQGLFAAGFCSRVIEGLLPEIEAPEASWQALASRLDTAERRLLAERREIDRELGELRALRASLGLAPDTGVRADTGSHDTHPAPVPAAPDHRGRRLR